MKTKLIITAAAVAGAFLITYLAKKRRRVASLCEPVPVKKSHHLTDVFAHAKNHIR